VAAAAAAAAESAPAPAADEPPAAPPADEAAAEPEPAPAGAHPGHTVGLKRPQPPRPGLRRGVRPHGPPGAEPPATQVAVAPAGPEPAPAAPAAEETAPPAAAPPAAAPPAAAPERAADPLPMPSPAPPPPPPPPAPPQVAAAPPAPRSLDAVPQIASFDVQGSLAASVARRAVERVLPGLRSCYATAARASKTAPAVELHLSFEIDENSMATHVAAGDVQFGSFGRCAASAAGQIHTTQAPDVGTAHVTVVIKFHPS
jgi:hypothetical protein